MIEYTFERECILFMASKGQKFKKYTTEFKEKIIQEYLSGETGGSRSLSKKYGIPCGTIDVWIYKYKKRGNLTTLKRGRPKGENIDYKERYEILKKYQTFLKAQREKK